MTADLTTPPPSPDDSVPLEIRWKIHGLCERFEEEFLAGKRPAIEFFLSTISGEGHAALLAALLAELLAVELELRRSEGEKLERAEYLSRFPDHPRVVREAFARVVDRKLEESFGPATVTYQRIDPQTATDRYQPVHFHARGGMGEVWVAEDTELGRKVALKTLREKLREEPQRFLAEAQITGQLEHPSVVPVHDVGIDKQGHVFYVMKFVHGKTLKEEIQDLHADRNGSSSDRAVREVRLLDVFVDMCEAIAFAHSRGVLHRDIKPDNVMVGDFGETLVLDWGVAKVLNQPDLPDDRVVVSESGPSGETRSGSLVGTPSYMSPEVAEGHADVAGPPSDVYLLGGTLYHLLTGQAPRRGRSRTEIVEMARTVPPVPPRQLNKRVSKAMEAVCMKAMATRPEDRYASPSDLAADIRRHRASEPVSAYREGLFEQGWRWVRRHRRVLSRVAVGLLVVAALGIGMLGYGAWSRERLQADIDDFNQQVHEAHFYGGSVFAAARPWGSSAREDAGHIEHEVLSPPQDVGMYDHHRALEAGRAAIAIADRWGRRLDDLPNDQRESVQADFAQLLLLLAQIELAASNDQEVRDRAVALLDRAEELDAGGEHAIARLRAAARGENVDSRAAFAEGIDPDSWTAVDHFMAGEYFRLQSGASRDELTRKQRLQQARDRFLMAIDQDPRHYWARFQLGRCYLALGQFTEAAEALSACVGLLPDAPWAYSTLAGARSQQARAPGLDLSEERQLLSSAEQNINQAMALCAKRGLDDRPVRLNRALIQLLNGRRDEALADLGLLVEHRPPLREAHYYRGWIHLEAGNYREASADFDALIAERSGFHYAYLPRARARAHLGNVGGTVADLDAHYGNQANALTRGIALRRLATGNANQAALLQRAEVELRQAIANGGGARAYVEFANLLAKLQRPAEAIEFAGAGLALYPDNLPLLETRGALHFVSGDPGSAEADFARGTEITLADDATDFERTTQAMCHAWMGILFAMGGDSRATHTHLMMSIRSMSRSEYRTFALPANQASACGLLAQHTTDDVDELHDLALFFLEQAVDQAVADAVARRQMVVLMQGPDFGDDLRESREFQELLPQLLEGLE